MIVGFFLPLDVLYHRFQRDAESQGEYISVLYWCCYVRAVPEQPLSPGWIQANGWRMNVLAYAGVCVRQCLSFCTTAPVLARHFAGQSGSSCWTNKAGSVRKWSLTCCSQLSMVITALLPIGNSLDFPPLPERTKRELSERSMSARFSAGVH